jgi:predicted kinase
MLKTKRREELLLKACLEGKTKFVVDNTNLTHVGRARYIALAKDAGFRVIGYFFESRVADALQRNKQRHGDERIPDGGVLGASGRLESPSRDEGFDQLFFVRLNEPHGFIVEEWKE